MKNYITALINVYFYGNDQFQMVNGFWERTIPIETNYIPLTQFTITDKQKRELLIDGINGSIEYFLNI